MRHDRIIHSFTVQYVRTVPYQHVSRFKILIISTIYIVKALTLHVEAVHGIFMLESP